MTIDTQAVLDRIDVDELIKVALDLGNIDSPTGCEGPVGEYVYEWLRREGFDARKVALYADRPNVLATLPGTGGGRAPPTRSSTAPGATATRSSATASPTTKARWRRGSLPPRRSRTAA
jgi:acetylornithine deacetylase/succinyl-diaminopimelate desuccinylase-like protein